jgi:hypothetical protein
MQNVNALTLRSGTLMNKKRAVLFVIAMSTLCANVLGQFTLYQPTGVRSGAMGNCGYALSDDETSLLYNPAGLGLRNER